MKAKENKNTSQTACGRMRGIMVDLKESRRKMDDVDEKIVALFEERMKIACDVAEYKKSIGKQVFDKAREEEKLKMVSSYAHDEFNQRAVRELFVQIMSMSRKLQYTLLQTNEEIDFLGIEKLPVTQDTKIVFYGERGAYTEAAMLEYFGETQENFAASSFAEVMQAVKDGKADYGVLPIENTSTGSLSDIYDLLVQYDNYIIGEHVLPIEHVLLGMKGAKLDEIETVHSHPQAIMQCSEFLKHHSKMKAIASGSTAESAKYVFELKDRTHAAIASKRAAACYGLDILAEGLANQDCNATRFIIITRQKVFLKRATHIHICFALPHESGSLFHMLSHFIYNNVNMTKIESRPIPGKPFEYRFFVEAEGNMNDIGIQNAINCIKEEAMELKILGSYEVAR